MRTSGIEDKGAGSDRRLEEGPNALEEHDDACFGVGDCHCLIRQPQLAQHWFPTLSCEHFSLAVQLCLHCLQNVMSTRACEPEVHQPHTHDSSVRTHQVCTSIDLKGEPSFLLPMRQGECWKAVRAYFNQQAEWAHPVDDLIHPVRRHAKGLQPTQQLVEERRDFCLENRC